MGGVLRYKLEVYCQYFLDKLYGLGAPKQCPVVFGARDFIEELLGTSTPHHQCPPLLVQPTLPFHSPPRDGRRQQSHQSKTMSILPTLKQRVVNHPARLVYREK